MPKNNNYKSQISNDSNIDIQLLRRNAKSVMEPKRSELLEEILEDSSSVALNDVSNYLGARQVLDGHSRLLSLLDELKLIESSINPNLPVRNEKSWDRFFEWINGQLSQDKKGNKSFVPLNTIFDIVKSKNEEISPSSVQNIDSKQNSDEYSNVDGQNCSLAAKVPFMRGDIVFNIHRKCMLTTETALKDEDLGDFIRNDSIASAMPNIALVLHVLNEHCKGQKSPWYHYLNIMPNKILPVLSMKKEQWKQLLPSAHIYDALKMIRSISRQYSYFYKQLQSTDLPLKKTITFQYYCWGVSIVCSRQNEIPPSDRHWCPGPVINALIPILDMCNHECDSNQAIFEDDHSKLFAPKNIEKGDEIRISYGTRTSGEFYIHNGFVPDNVGLDMLPVNLSLNPQDSQYTSRKKLLKILNMPSFGRFKLVANTKEMRHRRDPHLTMFFIVYLLPEEDLEMILKDDNPVGLADSLYEYVQYTNYQILESGGQLASGTEKSDQSGENNKKLLDLGQKLSSLIEQYSSKRASIGVALINRALNSGLSSDLSRLLQHERTIYQSYVKRDESVET